MVAKTIRHPGWTKLSCSGSNCSAAIIWPSFPHVFSGNPPILAPNGCPIMAFGHDGKAVTRDHLSSGYATGEAVAAEAAAGAETGLDTRSVVGSGADGCAGVTRCAAESEAGATGVEATVTTGFGGAGRGLGRLKIRKRRARGPVESQLFKPHSHYFIIAFCL